MISKNFLKKIFVLAIILFFSASATISTTGNIPLQKSTIQESEINMVDETTIKLNINNLEFKFDSISTENGMFSTIEIPGKGYATSIGEAKLPMLKYMLEIPQNAEPEITIKSIEWESKSLPELGLPIKIIPFQPSIQKDTNTIQDFVIDKQYYSINSFIPKNIAHIVDTGEIRGHRFILVEISPIQYNPSTGELKTINICQIIINLPNSNMMQTYEKIQRYTSSAFEDLFKGIFDNYGYYEKNIASIEEDGFLIIVHDDFYEEIQPLVELKTSKGYDTTVTKTSDIPGGATKENIKEYIEEAYNEWSNPPSYILLVGDTPQIPTYPGTTGPSAADLYYVTMNSEDYFPDIYIGRFPAAQESHVTAMIEKTVYYEKGNFNSTEWIKKAAFMAGNDYYYVTEGTHNYVIDIFLEPNEYNCTKLYQVTYGATTQDVKDALNDGRSLAIYSGHGNSNAWGDGPPFSQSDVSGLTNYEMYPFVCSHACLTGTFDISECFGETWLRAADKAGLAFWGASASTYWNEDDILEKGMFQAWWDNQLVSIGGMTDMALYYVYENYSGGEYSKYYYECYNVLGDPSIIIWTDTPNKPPETPEAPNGPNEGATGVEYSFSTSTTDPEGDKIYYQFNWGDGTFSDWLGPYEPKETAKGYHIWKEENLYEVKVKAKNENSGASQWSNSSTINILQAPTLKIRIISGGLFKVKAIIRNIGSLDATDVNWSISLNGGAFIGKNSEGTIPLIKAGREETITLNPIIGLGETKVTVHATIPESSDSRTQNGKIYLFYIIVTPSGS